MLCYRCGGHVKDGSENCASCGQQFALGQKPGPIAGFGAGSRRHRVAVEGAPCKAGDAIAGRFLIKDGLGAGPLGWVFRALDQESGEQVAIKILSPRFLQLPEERVAFGAQMQRALAIDHPNAARAVAAGIDGDKPWVASQLLEGLTLRRIMDLRRQKGQGFGLHEVEPILAQIASALEAAPFAHGDLKPDNVLVLPDLLKLTDFGLGLCLPRVPFVAAQRAGGVHRYLAPELQAGERPDGRSDVFALGALLGELLAEAPFEPSLDLRAKLPSLPRAVEEVFTRATSPRGSDRHAAAGQLVADLADALGGDERESPGREPEVVVQRVQTDPRVRLTRALDAQDRELAAARIRRENAAASSAQPAPPATPPHPAADPPRASAKAGHEAAIQPPQERRALPPAALPPLQLAPLVALPPLSAPPPLTMPPRPVLSSPASLSPQPRTATPLATLRAPSGRVAPSADEVARVAASVGVEPELLTADTAVKAAPIGPPGSVARPAAPTPAAPPPEAAVGDAPVLPPSPAPAPVALIAPVASGGAGLPAPAPLPLAASPVEVVPAPAAHAVGGAASPLAASPAGALSETPSPAPAKAGPGEGTSDGSDSEGSDGLEGAKGRKRRGKRGRKEEARKRQRDPEWVSGAGTSAPQPNSAAATAIGAQTPAFEALPPAAVEDVAHAESKATPTPGHLAAEPVPTRPPPRRSPAFGALAAPERKLPVPLIGIGVAVLVGLGLWGYGNFIGSEAPPAPAAAAPAPPATKAEAKPEPKPAAAAEAVLKEGQSEKTLTAAPAAPAATADTHATPVKPEARAAAPVPAPARTDAAEAASAKGDKAVEKLKKKSFLERMRERREARSRAQEEALAGAASRRAASAPAPAPVPGKPPAAMAAPATAPVPAPPAAAAPLPPAANPAPAPAPVPAPPPSGGAIAGLGDGDSLLASKAPKKPVALALAAAPSIAANDAACPMGMKLIPGGPAQVGTDASDDLRNFGDRPPATVDVKAFCIDSFEYPNKPGQLPKIAAAFSEAEASCKKDGKRLCTEDEWEKTCRGPQNLRFPYGPNFDPDACNTQDKGTNPRKITVVGIFGTCRSGYGVFDLSGNAAEWTASPFEGGAPERAVKGGSASRPGFDDRCSSRRRLAPGAHDVNVGFRCCAETK